MNEVKPLTDFLPQTFTPKSAENQLKNTGW